MGLGVVGLKGRKHYYEKNFGAFKPQHQLGYSVYVETFWP